MKIAKQVFSTVFPAIFATLLAALLVPLAGATESLGFKGQAIGSSSLAITQDPRFDCREVHAPTADQICTLRPKEQETIAGVRVNSLYYFYDRARLTGITLSLPEIHFANVVRALEEKYGPPQAKTENIQNHKGADFENRILTWRQGNARLEAQRYVGRLDQSMIRLRDDAAADRIRQRHALAPGQDL